MPTTVKETAKPYIAFTGSYGGDSTMPYPMNSDTNRDNVPEYRLGTRKPTTNGDTEVFGVAGAAIEVTQEDQNSGNCSAATPATDPYKFTYQGTENLVTVVAPYSMVEGQYGWFKVKKTL